MLKTFSEAYAGQEEMGKKHGNPGCIDKVNMAVNAAEITIGTEIGLMLMV